LGKLFTLLQAGLLFTALWRDGLKSQSLSSAFMPSVIWLAGVHAVDKRFHHRHAVIRVRRFTLSGSLCRAPCRSGTSVPVRWLAILIAIRRPVSVGSEPQIPDEGTILASNVLHAADAVVPGL
jgi:hypothetical protein